MLLITRYLYSRINETWSHDSKANSSHSNSPIRPIVPQTSPARFYYFSTKKNNDLRIRQLWEENKVSWWTNGFQNWKSKQILAVSFLLLCHATTTWPPHKSSSWPMFSLHSVGPIPFPKYRYIFGEASNQPNSLLYLFSLAKTKSFSFLHSN